MEAKPKKPTAAQAEWLHAIHKGGVTRNGHAWANGMRASGYRSTYSMTIKLRDAGWIAEVEAKPGGPYEDRYPLVLTDAGRAAIGV